jgi:rhodanese-related sulfurtransferase
VAALTSGAEVRLALRQRTEIGLLDVRPEGPFAEGHPLFAASFPLGRLEGEVLDRLPRRSVPLVVYGHGATDAAAAAGRLQSLGYRGVSLLEGGHPGRAAGQLRALLRSMAINGDAIAAGGGAPGAIYY